jgi:peptide/nickel transport system substrate-binding protein
MAGYWAGAEDIGYGYDLDKAQSLLIEAGYTLDADGKWTKDGQPFQVTLHVGADSGTHVKTAQVLQQQFKAFGVEVTLESVEGISIWGFLAQNEYQFSVLGITYTSVDVIMGLFHSAYIGVFNMGGVNDPELDPLLEKTRATLDAAEQAKYVEQSHTRIIEQAYMIPLFAPKHFLALSHRIKGAVFSPKVTLAAGYTQIYLDDAYIESGP